MILDTIITILWMILQGYGAIMSVGILLSWIPNAFNLKPFRWVRAIGGWYLDQFYGRLILGSLDFGPLLGLFVYEILANSLLVFLWM